MPRLPVELTLIPIAAILLLLTGFNAPAQPAVEAISSAAVLRLWLSRDRMQSSRRQARPAPRRRSPGVIAAPTEEADAQAQELVTARAQLCARERSRAVFRTRFGIATGAYQPAAPPRRA